MTTTTEYGTWCNRVDQYSTSVEQTVVKAFGDEGPDGFDVDAIVSDYRAAINEALPDGVTLAGDQFYGPYRFVGLAMAEDQRNFGGYPLNEDGGLDFKAIVDGIDLWDIIRHHEVTAEGRGECTVNVVDGSLVILVPGAEDTDILQVGGKTLGLSDDLEPWGEAEEDMERADAALAKLGWKRVGEWRARTGEHQVCVVEVD